MHNHDGKRPSKTEFVWVMSQLAKHDRAKYRELRAAGWKAVERAEICINSELAN